MSSWFKWSAAIIAAVVTFAGSRWLAGHFDLGLVDDAFISLRYAANWAEGRGLCFNAGETVEGYTNFLLVLLETSAIRLGADPLVFLRMAGWVSLSLLGGAVAFFASQHLFRGDPFSPAVIGIVTALQPILLCWAASGMESCLYALLLWGAAVAVLGNRPKPAVLLTGAALVFAAMTRPEAVALFPVFAIIVWMRFRSGRYVGLFAGIFLLGYGGYFVARAIHFGYPFPNTFYAKLDYGSAELLRRGAVYVGSFLGAMWIVLALNGVALCLIRKSPAWVRVFLVVSVSQLAIVVYEGGDHFAMYRFMVPILPLLCALAMYPFSAAVRRFRLGPNIAALSSLTGVLLVAVSGILMTRQTITVGASSISQFDRFRFECRLAEQWTEVGRFLRAAAPADATVCTLGIGAIGYYSGMTVLDPLGIVDPVIAHRPGRASGGAAGHDKFDNDYVLSRKPTYIILLAVLTPQPWPREAQRRVLSEDAQRVNLDLFGRKELNRDYRFENVRVGRRYLNFYVRNGVPTPVAWIP